MLTVPERRFRSDIDANKTFDFKGNECFPNTCARDLEAIGKLALRRQSSANRVLTAINQIA